MTFSIVLPTYNRAETLCQTLTAATRQTYDDCEVLAVDDGSTDATAEMVARDFRLVRLICQSDRGPTAARNRGIVESSGEIIAFTDDDCAPRPYWLARLADGYARYPNVAGVGGSLWAPKEVLAHNAIAQYEQYVARIVYRAGEVESLGGFECPAGGTANMSYQASVLSDVGGFDDSFPVAAGEDADLKLRICQKGHQLLYIPVRVTHLQSYSWRRFRQQRIVRGIGRSYFELRHGAGWPSRAKVALRLIRRFLTFGADLISFPNKRVAVVKLMDGIYTCRGQWTRPQRATSNR